MMMKGTAWAQVKQLDTEQLLDPDKGVQVLLTAISKCEEAEEMQLYDKFERALYKTHNAVTRQLRALSTGCRCRSTSLDR
jgi:hypothetical protein